MSHHNLDCDNRLRRRYEVHRRFLHPCIFLKLHKLPWHELSSEKIEDTGAQVAAAQDQLLLPCDELTLYGLLRDELYERVWPLVH